MKDISVLITTFNRKNDLKCTLCTLRNYIKEGISVLVCDDASTDGTSEFIREFYPEIKLFINPINEGLIFSRNLLLNQVQTRYAISLDDDANFISLNPFEKIVEYFNREPKSGVIAFRIFWGLNLPESIETSENSKIVKSYVGCGHAWRMECWNEIPDYPAWYRFYGEENFASLNMVKTKWEVHYVPVVLVQHRVNNTSRKFDIDYYVRGRRAIRADWFNYFIFYPRKMAIKAILYSIKMQILKALRNNDIKLLRNIALALLGVLINLWRLQRNRNTLSTKEYEKWIGLSNSKIYWKPDEN